MDNLLEVIEKLTKNYEDNYFKMNEEERSFKTRQLDRYVNLYCYKLTGMK